MAAQHFRLPRARRDVVTQELPDELLVYDTVRHKAHCLNRAAALVWKHCDGKTTIAQMGALLEEAGLPPGVEVIELALNELERAHLLAERMSLPGSIQSRSRRALLKKAGLIAGAALAIPLVQSIVAPTVAQAASCLAAGSICPGAAPCCSGRCVGGFCV
jgi:hypothetical protein